MNKAIKLTIIILISVLQISSAFDQVHTEHSLLSYYQKNSFKPILHAYFNHHFKNSKQFENLQQILDDIDRDYGDFIGILYTNCDEDRELELHVCEKMRKTKDNRQIVGTVPSSEFRQIGRHLIQSPPKTQILDHSRDVYSYQQLRDFMIPLLPNFYKELNNLEQYEDLLQTRYSPKLIVFVREDQEIPLVLKEIGITFFLRMDLAIVSDLNEELMEVFNVTKFPSFVIVKYNYDLQNYEYFYQHKFQFTEEDYQQIKTTLSPYSLQKQRNDLVFHKIRMPTTNHILVAENHGQLQQIKDQANGWQIIMNSNGKVPQKLLQLQQKYDRYFSYVNHISEPVGDLVIYNPTDNVSIPITDQIPFNSLSFEHFHTNLTVWLKKDAVVLGLSQTYSHLCGVTQKQLFKDHVRCLIIDDNGLQELKDFMKIEFEVGFIMRLERLDGNQESKGVRLSSNQFQSVYQDLEYATRMKIKQDLDLFLKNPVSQIPHKMKLGQACFHPLKKCLLLLADLKKSDRTLQEYIKQIAFDFMNSFIVYEIDIEINPELLQIVGSGKDKKADLIVYNPRSGQFTKLNKKITKNLIRQFFKANLKNDKRLKKQENKNLSEIAIKRRGVREAGDNSEEL